MSFNIQRLHQWIPSSTKTYPLVSTQEAINVVTDQIVFSAKAKNGNDTILDACYFYLKHVDDPEGFIQKVSACTNLDHPLYPKIQHLGLMVYLCKYNNIADAFIQACIETDQRHNDYKDYNESAYLNRLRKCIKTHLEWITEQFNDHDREILKKKITYSFIDSMADWELAQLIGRKLNIPEITERYLQLWTSLGMLMTYDRERMTQSVIDLYVHHPENARVYIRNNIQQMTPEVLSKAYEKKYIITGDPAFIDMCLASMRMQAIPTGKEYDMYQRGDMSINHTRLCDPALLFANLLASDESTFARYKDQVLNILDPMCEDIMFMQAYFAINTERVLECMQHENMLVSYLGMISAQLFELDDGIDHETQQWLTRVFQWNTDFFAQDGRVLFEQIGTALWNRCNIATPIQTFFDTCIKNRVQQEFGIIENLLDSYLDVKNTTTLGELEIEHDV